LSFLVQQHVLDIFPRLLHQSLLLVADLSDLDFERRELHYQITYQTNHIQQYSLLRHLETARLLQACDGEEE
jgi:hypothetical protein